MKRFIWHLTWLGITQNIMVSAVDSIKFQMPGAQVHGDDEYLSVQIPVPNPSIVTYISAIKAIHDEKVHHIIVNGCSNTNTANGGSIGSTQSFRCNDKKILYAWALNAGELVLPEGAAVPIGGHSNVFHIQLECHYKDRFVGKDFLTGVEMTVAPTKPQKLVGIFLLGSMHIYLPPKEWTNVHVSCPYRWNDEIEVFAYRTHAHSNGKVITGSKLDQGGHFEMIGKGNPQWPHAFFTRVGGPIKLGPGDDVFATCRYYNDNDFFVGVGGARTDEMCNLYLMYTAPYKNEPLEGMSCWGYSSRVDSEDLEKHVDVETLTPYPGYTGPESDKLIKDGKWSMPPIPEEMGHHHHAMGGGGHDDDEDDHHHEDMHGHMNGDHDGNDHEDDDHGNDDHGNDNHEDEHKTAEKQSESPFIFPDFSEKSDYSLDDAYIIDDYAPLEIKARDNDDLSIKFQSVEYDSSWTPNVPLGEVAGVDTDDDGTLWVFHRGDRTWDANTFQYNSDIIANQKPIEMDVVYHFASNGTLLHSWGKNTVFLLPHGITVDRDYIWLTDVGSHQIYKFTKSGELEMTIGQHTFPGLGEYQFCKPADVFIDDSSGEIYVADGYCNRRVARYTSGGKYVDSINGDFDVVHDISKGPDNTILIADREHGKLHSYDIIKKKTIQVYEKDQIGPNIYASYYSTFDANIYLVNGAGYSQNFPVHGFALNRNDTILDNFVPNKELFQTPHDIAVSKDGRCIYIAQLRPHKVFKFHVTGDDIIKENGVYDALSIDKIDKKMKEMAEMAMDHPYAIWPSVLALAVLVLTCIVCVVRRRNLKKPTKTYVYKPLLDQEAEESEEEEEIYSRSNVA